MAKEETPDDRSGLEEVQITVVVVPGRIRATLTRLLARARVRAGLVFGALAPSSRRSRSSSHRRAVDTPAGHSTPTL